MYLKSLQISGFKSFAKKTTLTFTRGITAIVGPNGSGKSNIADAIRWVMGEQSIKTLRGKKSEDVIFSGSDKKTRLGLAEVSLELDNSDKKVPIDYSDFLISRRIYRSGESDYLINNSKSKLSDVNLLLTKANFGHRTYSVIGQGMIDNFLIASPAERKEFFEEATGVKQYQIKKNQALLKLEHVWQNLGTLKIKTNEMEPQLRLLTRQVKKLQKRKEMEKELSQAKLSYYSPYWQEIDNNYLLQKHKIDKTNLEKEKIYTQWKELEQKLNQLTKDSSSSQEINQLRDQQKKLLDEKVELKEKILTINLNQHKNNIVKNISPQELEQINQDIEQINELISRLGRQENIESLKQNINQKINKVLNSLKPYLKEETRKPLNTQKLDSQLIEIDSQINYLQDKINRLQEQDSQNRSNLWQLQKEFQSAQNKLNDINNQINESRISLARVETKRFDLKQEIQYELHGLENLNQKDLPLLTEQEKITQQNKINRLKNQLEIIGGLDQEIEREFKASQERYNFLIGQIDDLTKTSDSLKKLMDELDEIIKQQVHQSFSQINEHFQKYFKILFQGGRAELVLIKEKTKNFDQQETKTTAINFFQEKNKTTNFSGIEVSATPPGKRLKSINALSGGERALISIALICAIISSNPAPFVVLDEVDASLDESNSNRFAEILDNLSHKTQFIVITHNRATMERANLLYGVTMGDDGVSKLLSIKLNQAKKYNK